MAVLEVQNLSKVFGKVIAVNDISFVVEKGEIFGFLGPNGAGKTTTIRCLLNFLQPTSGIIKIFDQDIVHSGEIVRENIGYLPGDVRLFSNWTGNDHINFIDGLRKKKSISKELASKLDLDLNKKFKALSSGNKQKLGLVLALGFEPELLIMDEPTVGLDPLLQSMIYEVLEDFQKKGTTIFMSSHNLTEVDRLCHRVGIIKNGKLIAIEKIQELKDKRMHIVNIRFNGPIKREDFILPNIEIKNQTEDMLILGITGNINPLIQRLANYDVRELEFSHAKLEDIFLEFYGGNHFEKSPNNLEEIPKLE